MGQDHTATAGAHRSINRPPLIRWHASSARKNRPEAPDASWKPGSEWKPSTGSRLEDSDSIVAKPGSSAGDQIINAASYRPQLHPVATVAFNDRSTRIRDRHRLPRLHTKQKVAGSNLVSRSTANPPESEAQFGGSRGSPVFTPDPGDHRLPQLPPTKPVPVCNGSTRRPSSPTAPRCASGKTPAAAISAFPDAALTLATKSAHSISPATGTSSSSSPASALARPMHGTRHHHPGRIVPHGLRPGGPNIWRGVNDRCIVQFDDDHPERSGTTTATSALTLSGDALRIDGIEEWI